MKKRHVTGFLGILGVSAVIVALSVAPGPKDAADPPLKVSRVVRLPSVAGRLDHLAVDAGCNYLYVAAVGNDSVEVIDLQVWERTRTIRVPSPQDVVAMPDSSAVAVSSSADGSVRFYSSMTLAEQGRAEFKPDADNLRYDRGTRRLYVGFDSALGFVDEQGKRLAAVKLKGHPEAFVLETQGPRIFVNVPAGPYVAIVDRNRAAVSATWSLGDAKDNYAMALDETHRRLFVACRAPAEIVVINIDNGNVVTTFPCAPGADDMFFDPDTRRIYVTGAGQLDVFREEIPDRYWRESRTRTGVAARTSVLIPALGLIAVAVPQPSGGCDAEVRFYKLP